MTGIGIGQPLLNNAVDESYNNLPNVDAKYGPYATIDAANTAINKTARAIGLTVGIITDGTIAEYWYESGIEDSNLIRKISNAPSTVITINKINSLSSEDNGTLNGLYPNSIIGDWIINLSNGFSYLKYDTDKWIKFVGVILGDVAVEQPKIMRVSYSTNK